MSSGQAQLSTFGALVVQLPQPSADCPDVLYHYTDRRGLIGIIEGGKVWATHIQYLNDSSEYSMARKLAGEYAAYVLTGLTSAEDQEFVQGCKTQAGQFTPKVNCFVFSLSGDGGDRLSQWRAYTKPADAYSIGFAAADLRQFCATSGYYLVDCVYDVAAHYKLLKDVFDLALATFRGQPAGIALAGRIANGVQHFEVLLHVLAARLKDRSFEEEREWRIVVPYLSDPIATVRYRAGRSLVTPYVELSPVGADGKLPIKQLQIGPTPHYWVDVTAVIRLCRSKGINPSAVPISSIPYRAW